MNTLGWRQVIKVNFDNLRADGRLTVHMRRFYPVRPELGAKIRAVDEDGDEDMDFDGTVTGFSDDYRRVFVTMDWADA